MDWFPRFHQHDLGEQLKQARHESHAWYKRYDRSADPSDLAKAKTFETVATSLEHDIELVAKAAGKPDLLKELKAARQLIAKTYTVERALNVGDGNVSAAVMGRMLDQGKPLTGELKLIGRFAQAFPSVAREGAKVPSPGVSGTDAAATAILGTMGYGQMGPPGVMAAGLPLLRGPARRATLSETIQNRLVRPQAPLRSTILKSTLAGRELTER
jgi:hypothetical protein